MFKGYRRGLCVEVVGDGAIATAYFADGRLIPVLIVDKHPLPSIEDFIRAHEHNPPSDVRLSWGVPPFSRGQIVLHLEAKHPVEIDIGIMFDVQKQHSLIDGLMYSRGFYLQAGVHGDRIGSTWDNDRIVIEVPELKFGPAWNKILHACIRTRFRKSGLSKKESNQAAEQYVNNMRSLWKLRMQRSMTNDEQVDSDSDT